MMRRERNQLEGEVLTDQTVEALRIDSLAALLSAARKRRAARRAKAGLAFVCSTAIAAWLLVPRVEEPTITAGPLAAPAVVPAVESKSTVKQISDAELLSLFPGQTVALIGPPGNQRFLVFGETPEAP